MALGQGYPQAMGCGIRVVSIGLDRSLYKALDSGLVRLCEAIRGLG
jgi:hypothetical protein